MIRLNKEQLVSLHLMAIAQTGGSEGIRDEGLLESAINAPFQSFDGEDLYPSIAAKAARMCCSLIRNHPFVDGNVNTKYFSCPIDDIDYACLSNYLNAETKKILGSYAYKKNTYYHDAEKYGYFHNQLYTEALQDLKKIERRICGKDAFYLDRLFAFCNLYHRYQNNSKMIANVKEGALDNGEKDQGSAK